MSKYLVELEYDGPVFTVKATVKIPEAVSEGDAVREALAYLGLPKVRSVTRVWS